MQFTTIHHSVRKQFSLSCNEYCIADMIFYLSANPKAPVTGWCNQSRGNMADEMGLSRRSVIDLVKSLIEKGLVEKSESDFLRTTQIWYDAITGAKSNIKQGVKNPHRCEESSQGVKNPHTTGEESSHLPSEESSHNNNSIDNNTNKENNSEPTGSFSSTDSLDEETKKKRKGYPAKSPKEYTVTHKMLLHIESENDEYARDVKETTAAKKLAEKIKVGLLKERKSKNDETPVTDEDILTKFKSLIKRSYSLVDFYQFTTVAKLNSDYNAIVELLRKPATDKDKPKNGINATFISKRPD